MSRWKAAAIHSSISAAIACAAAALMFIWFSPYFRAAGAPELILLLVGVDVCVGPLLTLIIFRSGKRGLLFDLACIGVLQTAALVYGLYVMSQSRPVFLVAAVDRFELIAANEISDSDLADGQEPQFRSRSWWGPRVVGVALPTDLEARNDLVFSGAGGRDIQNLPTIVITKRSERRCPSARRSWRFSAKSIRKISSSSMTG